ncbi:hypothetical protein ACFE04_006282 [Oxalis oulophora]
MENFPYSTYADSGDSSPQSHEIDSSTATTTTTTTTTDHHHHNNNNNQSSSSWDETMPPLLQSSHSAPAVPTFTSFKVKFMCSYGGKIQPRPNYNQLAYIGGDTKILAVDRNIKFTAIMAKLSSLCCYDESDMCFKYQLPGEDLDALISVTNDEDLEHMMLEYDRLYRASAKPARLRLFLFPLNTNNNAFHMDDVNSERQWFVDALNSMPLAQQGTSPHSPKPPVVKDSDFFVLDNAKQLVEPIPELVGKEFSAAGSDCGSEERHLVGDPSVVVSPSEIQRQIHELQRLQIAAGVGVTGIDQGGLQRTCYDGNQRMYNEHYYKLPEKMVPTQAQATPTAPVQVQYPAYMQERNMASVVYPVGVAPSSSTEQQVYYVPASGGVYHSQAIRPVAGPLGQTYYGVYNAVPQPASPAVVQQSKMVSGYNDGYAVMQQQQQQPPKAVAPTEQSFVQVGYDSTGRQVYYTTTSPGAVSGSPQYQGSMAVDTRQVNAGGPANNSNQEGKVVVNMVPQTSSL